VQYAPQSTVIGRQFRQQISGLVGECQPCCLKLLSVISSSGKEAYTAFKQSLENQLENSDPDSN
jgi:hypothetical protein